MWKLYCRNNGQNMAASAATAFAIFQTFLPCDAHALGAGCWMLDAACKHCLLLNLAAATTIPRDTIIPASSTLNSKPRLMRLMNGA